jgi:putative Holliday junction resolvase
LELAIDYGRKRIGIATVFFSSIINNKGWKKVVPQIEKIIEQKSIDTLVFGLPLNVDGTESIMSAEVREFARRFNIKKEFIDERYTSLEALELHNKEFIDDISAKIILERYKSKQFL